MEIIMFAKIYKINMVFQIQMKLQLGTQQVQASLE